MLPIIFYKIICFYILSFKILPILLKICTFATLFFSVTATYFIKNELDTSY